jgi:hypothetical protein
MKYYPFAYGSGLELKRSRSSSTRLERIASTHDGEKLHSLSVSTVTDGANEVVYAINILTISTGSDGAARTKTLELIKDESALATCTYQWGADLSATVNYPAGTLTVSKGGKWIFIGTLPTYK